LSKEERCRRVGCTGAASFNGDSGIPLKAESAIRRGVFDGRDVGLGAYWSDIVQLLEIFRYSKFGGARQIVRLKHKMSSHVYDPYIEKKKQRAARKQGQVAPVQEKLFDRSE